MSREEIIRVGPPYGDEETDAEFKARIKLEVEELRKRREPNMAYTSTTGSASTVTAYDAAPEFPWHWDAQSRRYLVEAVEASEALARRKAGAAKLEA